ncbi:MAG: ORF6N domain-containing protein [Flavobacteriales bacterium]|nr:ORF6N domain-containing protein [Flavobacteriales bacterium]
MGRFPGYFMFILSQEESVILKSQNVPSGWGEMRKMPSVQYLL